MPPSRNKKALNINMIIKYLFKQEIILHTAKIEQNTEV